MVKKIYPCGIEWLANTQVTMITYQAEKHHTQFGILKEISANPF